ncbi:MAG TPA: ABC transporter ATP-binding protein [Streptosporangiaceae bacterium]|nr:ABC transporter ATP-binding protein [Streptosporangiaceae bacterium]
MIWGLEDVRVTFGRRAALDCVTVPVEPSRITVVVGGDGAGKSTCLRTLVGLLEPRSGIVRRPAKERTGYVPATAGLYTDLTVQENLDFCADAYRLAAAERGPRQTEILERTGLAAARHRLGGQLSGGMQRKLAVGLALLHSPDMLVLDEPTTGVDPVSRAELWRLISGAAARGTAVAVATTYVNEAARGSSVVLLEAGQVLASGSPDDILRGVPGAVGSARGRARPGTRSWRRGADWRVWAPDGGLPDGIARVRPDFEDAVVVAALAGEEKAGER